MRALLLLFCLPHLGACHREPSFDERYNEQSDEIGAQANGIERELGEQINASMTEGRIRTDPNAPAPQVNEATPP